MSWFSRCSWYGGPFNGGNCRRCTNVSFGDEIVRNPDPISNDETPDFSYPPSQPQTSSFDQFHCFHYGDPLEDCVRCQWCTCKWCGHGLREGFCLFCASRDDNSSIDAPNPNSFNDPPNVFTHPPQPQYESYSCELCGNDAHYGYDCPPWFPLVYEQESCYNQNFGDNYYPQNSPSCCENCGVLMKYSINHQPQSIQEDLNQQKMNDEFKIELRNELLNTMQSLCERILQREQAANESTIPLNEITSQIPPITPVLPTMEPEDSLIMGDEDLSTIPEKESDEFIKSSVENLVPIPSESEDTFGSNSGCDLPLCDDFSPINIPEGKSMTFSNLLFDSNDDFTSSDDESLSDEAVPEDNVKIYSNPLFKFDNEYISSDVNPLFDELLENIESKDFYDEQSLLVTPLSDANEDECFDPGGDIDEIEACLTSDSIPSGIDGIDFDPDGDILLLEKLLNDDPSSLLPLKELYFEDLKVIQSSINTSPDFEDDYYDSEGDIIYLESLLNNDTISYLPPEVFLDHDPRSLNDEPENLKSMVKVFDPGISEKKFSPIYVTDIPKMDKCKAKQTKPEHEIGRVQEIEAEGSNTPPHLERRSSIRLELNLQTERNLEKKLDRGSD
ncbi:hypothetical protein Tco_1185525 [Tanacetum coccineum]